jgi:hypothetical protein
MRTEKSEMLLNARVFFEAQARMVPIGSRVGRFLEHYTSSSLPFPIPVFTAGCMKVKFINDGRTAPRAQK